MHQKVCMIYPPSFIRSLHSYERNLSNQFDINIYRSYSRPSHEDTSNFGSIYQLLSNSIKSERFHRTLYSRWCPPSKYEKIISSRYIGKEIKIRPHQKHIHLAHGVHRGAFDLPPRTNFSNNKLYGFIQKTNRLLLRRREQRLLSNVDTLIVNSEFTARMMDKHHDVKPDKIIHPPIYTEDYYSDRDDHKGFYLYLGRLDRIKRVKEIVQAFNQLDQKLIVAGKGRLEQDLKQISEDNVYIAGFVSEQKKKTFLQTVQVSFKIQSLKTLE